jgi:hypothetical protein
MAPCVLEGGSHLPPAFPGLFGPLAWFAGGDGDRAVFQTFSFTNVKIGHDFQKTGIGLHYRALDFFLASYSAAQRRRSRKGLW